MGIKFEHNFSRNICISISSRCNLNCIYCYEKEKSIGTFNVTEAIDFLKENLSSKTSFGTKIKLHGGEPFLEFYQIKYLCESIWRERYEEYYQFHITTNGTMIHGDIQDWLLEHKDKITLKLSLDGAKTSHNINRSNSYDLIDIPFFVRNWPEIKVNMTITPLTVPYLAENVKYLHSLGLKAIIANFALMTDWSKYKLEGVLYGQLLELVGFYLNNPSIPPFNLFCLDISKTLNDSIFFSPCNIGKKTAYDFETKQYYPCHMFFPSVCGKISQKEFEKIDFTKRDGLEIGECKKCPFKNICRTCYAENYILRGSFSHRDMSLCHYQKAVFVSLFKFEYARVIQLKSPSYHDVKKMEAIKKWQQTISYLEKILNTLKHIE